MLRSFGDLDSREHASRAVGGAKESGYFEDELRFKRSPQPVDSVGDLGVSRCGSKIGGHARAVPPTDTAVEVLVVSSSPFW